MSARILAVDPGSTESAWTIIDPETCRPIKFGKDDNEWFRTWLRCNTSAWDQIVIEMVASYGMPVGAEVFETCVWIGRFVECAGVAELVYRRDVKLHHCGSSRAKDSNVVQALVDRFASGVSNHGKGSKAAPGWFYGFRADVWQAFALAVYVADRQMGRT